MCNYISEIINQINDLKNKILKFRKWKKKVVEREDYDNAKENNLNKQKNKKK